MNLRSLFRRSRRREHPDTHAEEPENASEAPTDFRAGIARADRFTFQDLVVEATTDIGSRPGRLVMTTLGTVLGIGSLVATIGFAQTAAGQIASQFDAVSATQVVVTPAQANTGRGGQVATGRLPWDAPDRVELLAGVEESALLAEVPLGEQTITAVPVNDPSAPAVASPALVAATSGVIESLSGTVVTGRSFDSINDERADRVALLGARAAERLGINRVDRQPSIFIGGVAYAVIGIVEGMERRADLLDAVVIPLSAARADFDVAAPAELQIKISVGAGPQVGEQAVIALAPDDPEALTARAPAAQSELGANVQADVNVVLLVIGGIALLAGGLGIANVTLLSVMERVGEIGLRRALGATRREVGAQFVVESIVVGLLGGLIGASLGVLVVTGVALVQQWAPIVDPFVAIGGALLGAVVGLVAGWYPARRAASIEPVAALRGS